MPRQRRTPGDGTYPIVRRNSRTPSRDHWYTEDGDDCAAALDGYATLVRRRLSSHFERLETFLRLYGGNRYANAMEMTPKRRPSMSVKWDERTGRPSLKLNIFRNMVDAATSRLSEQRYKPVYLPTAGDAGLQKRAKLRSRMVEGVLVGRRAYPARQRALRSCALAGFGFVEVCPEYGGIRYDYLFPSEVLVDDWIQQTSDPRVVIQERLVDREQLAAMYPDKREQILDSRGPDYRHIGRDPSADQVLIRKAYHLPSHPSANDGRYVVATTNALLYSQKWTRERTRIVPWQWTEPLGGFYGEGLGDQLIGIQREINSVLRTVAANVYYGGNLKIAVERGSKVLDAQLDNRIGGVRIDYKGVPPRFFAPDVFSPQLLAYLELLITQAHSITGFSELSVSSQIPAGLSGSGRSMLVYENVETKRFLSVARNDQDSVAMLAEATLDGIEDLCANNKAGFKAMYPHRNWLTPVDYKDVVTEDRDSLQLQMWPANLGVSSLAARTALLDNWLDRGIINVQEYRSRLEVPDISFEDDHANAGRDWADKLVDECLEDGKPARVHTRGDLKAFIERATDAYMRAETNEHSPARLDMLGAAIDLAQQLDEDRDRALAQKAAALAPPGPGATPPAAPPALQEPPATVAA